MVELGKLYSGIRAEKTQTKVEDLKPRKQEDPYYVKLCKRFYLKAKNLSKAKEFKEPYKSAIEFLDWKLTAREFDAAVKFVALSLIGVAFLLAIFTIFGYNILYSSGLIEVEFSFFNLLLFSIVIYGGLAAYGIYYFMNYPLNVIEKEKRKSLVYMPQIIGYIVMSLKLVPNLEKAVKFAALQGKGKLAEDLKKLLWDVNIGIYATVEDALDHLAYKWKKYSSEFKEALMMIKTALIEDNDAKREQVLDKTMDNVLESIKIKMEAHARALSQPSLVLFYVGILLPLLLVIVLPLGSTFSQVPLGSWWMLLLIYDIFLPLFVFLYAKKVINSMPSLYKPPTIPDNYKGLPKKNHLFIGKKQINIFVIVFLVFIIGLGASIFLQVNYGNTMEKIFQKEEIHVSEDAYFKKLATDSLTARGMAITKENLEKEIAKQRILFLMQPGHDITPYYIIYGLALTFALMFFIYFYFSTKYKKKIQDYYVNMEKEFKEILYILASKLGEGKPMEDALKSTKKFFSDLTISQDLIAKTLDNLNLLGLPLEQAFFDPMFGSLKNNPSLLIKNNIKLIVDAAKLGVHTAAKTILSIIDQLRNIDDIRELIKKVTFDIVQMMNTMTTMIGPAVLGITVSMEKIVVLTLNSLASSGSFNNMNNIQNMPGFGGFNLSSVMGAFKLEEIGNLATPTMFNIIILIYLSLLVIILSYYTSNLQEDNPLATRMLLAYTLPIAIIVFIVSSLLASLLLGGGFA